MRATIIIRALTLLACWLSLWSSGQAIVVFEKGKAKPTIGYLVSSDETRVVIREVSDDGSERTREILRADIEDLLITVSEQRLSELDPQKPNDYRNYAEELAVKRKDPDALNASLRLYLIAAHLAPDRLGRSCLLGMIPLARSPLEERRFRAMAYLLDPNHDASVLKTLRSVAGAENPAGRSSLLKSVQAMRRGNRRVALQLIDGDAAQAELKRHSDLITEEEFRGLGDEIAPDVLRRLLMLEWILTRDDESPDATIGTRETSWSRVAREADLSPTTRLTLETLTQFDPRACFYREGKWLRPEQLR